MIATSELVGIMPKGSLQRLSQARRPLSEAMDEYHIDTPLRKAAFVANLAHESGCFRYVEELASGDAYTHRKDLGNTSPAAVKICKELGVEAGPFWKGRGWIQITGYSNYLALSQDLGVDFVRNPAFLTGQVYASLSAAWFWNKKKLNDFADAGNFDAVCDIINRGHATPKIGDALGYSDRLAYYERAKNVFGVK